MANIIDLRPDNNLLNANFNGYKLSLDPIAVYGKSLESGVDHVKPNDEQYSFLHLKIFSLHNHLYANPFHSNKIYFIDKKWKIKQPVLNKANHISDIIEVLEIPSNHLRKPGHYNVSLNFAKEDLVIISDGAGTVHVAEINEEVWKIVYSENIFNDVCFIIVDSRCELLNDIKELNIVVLHIEDKNEDDKDSSFQTVLEWVVLTESKNKIWSKKLHRKFFTEGSVDYVALEPGCEGLHVAADKDIKFLYDSEKPIEPSKDESEVEVSKSKSYTWHQTADDITIWFPFKGLPQELKILVEATTVSIKRDDTLLLAGSLWQRVDKSLTSWTFSKDMVEILLTKHEPGQMWKELFTDDATGEEIIDPQLVAEVHQRLSHLCTDAIDEEKTQTMFNSQQLEECDIQSLDSAVLMRISSENHGITHEISLTNLQWLFKVQLETDKTPAICLRHDVDGCVWQFEGVKDKTWNRKHVGTFLAFGYVQASKSQKKFSVCSPNLSFVSICDASRHIYIYRQPSAISTELRNRRSGQIIQAVAKQQLVSLDTNDEILGIHASDKFIYILTENNFYVLHINVD